MRIAILDMVFLVHFHDPQKSFKNMDLLGFWILEYTLNLDFINHSPSLLGDRRLRAAAPCVGLRICFGTFRTVA